MSKIRFTSAFKRDYKRYKKKHYPMTKINKVISLIASNEKDTLINQYRLHALKGEWLGYKELHVDGDTLIIYIDQKGIVTLTRLGTHDQLF
ncbi:type II toxin-antitoxin system YafQ family toxin [Aerococcus tenax]|uniref:Type II toxin-antitoxin system YafQ family toxin n=1 Tax=Aerococcus tenax TaxID=3078812 RepID=A0A5N1BJU1_9LACT|nr:type II toxin-antitoxin system YafQ family toxin [Aerococcus urinae]KAA9238572.1 type II toxin-antitoxin system YafQ family toxin [Aerococcus urinae]MDK6689065.1 type II toxin-antitoxin system YafQ family toxin [Aerococcus urinae]